MKTFTASAESLIKQSPTDPWRISLVSPTDESLLKATIGKGGAAEVGPRLSEVLSSIERETNTYPCVIRWDISIDFADEFTVKVMQESILYVEIEIETYKYFLKNRRFVEGMISSSTQVIEYLPKAEINPVQTLSINAISEGLAANQDYFLIGRLSPSADGQYDGVRDGDTIDIQIEAMGSKVQGAIPSPSFEDKIRVGGTVGIRFVGIQTPETNDHSASYGDDKNTEYGLKFNLDNETVYAIGAEAREWVRNTLNANYGYIVIDLDITSAGKIQVTHDRIMGIVYKTDTTNLTDILDGNSIAATHLNKSLLVEKSKDHEDIPLALLYEYYADYIEYSRFDVAVWEYELGLKDKGDHEDVGDVADDIIKENSSTDNPNPVNTNPIEIRYSETAEYDNRLNWFKPFDDRMDQPELNLPLLSDCNVRIGDVMLVIPPLSIQYNRMTTSEKIKTLRTKQSTIIRSGNAESTLTLQLYFHDLDSINGHAWDNGHGRIYHMDGLRSLIAQFKKAPFLPIDNPYINEVLNIFDVALIDIAVSTVPGFPNSLSATLRLAKFEVAPYMPQIPGLGWSINYPMLRWYYQEAMKESTSPLRTYLKPLDPATCGEFKFLLADEMDLTRRQKAIEKLRLTATPEEIVDQIQNEDSQIGKLIGDAKRAQLALKQYDAYILAKQGKEILDGTQDWYTYYPDEEMLSEDASISPTSLINGGEANHGIDHRQVWNDMYGEDADAGSVYAASGHFAPYESILFVSAPSYILEEKYQMKTMSGSDEYIDESLAKIYYDTKKQGFFRIYLKTGANQNSFDEKYRVGDTEEYIVPATLRNVTILQTIVQAGKDAEVSAQESIDEYKVLSQIAEWNEGSLPLYEYAIDDLICTSLSVSYQNHFSGANLPGLEGPAMQYLGGQDPQIQVTFETTETGVEDFRFMLEEVDRYAREYRLGITAGFMGVENGLAGLFGIDTIIPEHIVISTVPNFPGRFQIEAVLCGFNKTQRRTETLEGISPIYSTEGGNETGDVNLGERHYSNGDMESQDNAVFEYRMRSLEVYADLELPTYAELNAALPKMGADCLEYNNPTKAKFVDPDFYVSTEWTLREDIRSERNNDQRMYFRDMLGVQMYTDSADSTPINGDAENWDLLRKVNDKTKAVNPKFTWNESGAASIYTPVDTQSTDGTEVQATAEVAALIENRESLRTKPTYQEWVAWGMSTTTVPDDGGMSGGQLNVYRNKLEEEYQAWTKNPQPSQVEIYDYIYSKVDALFKDYYFNDKKKTSKDKSWMEIAYSKGSMDVFKASYESLTGEDPTSIVEGGDPGGEKTKIKVKDWEDVVKGKIPRERLANLVKATFHHLSGWKQFSSGGFPNIVGHGTNMEVGIGRVSIAKHATTAEQAIRFCFDWKYNMDFAMDLLSKSYVKAVGSDNKAINAAPWDWMIHGWEDPEFENTSVDNDFFRSVYSTFDRKYNSYDWRYGTAQSPVDIQILEREEGVTADQKKLLQGNRQFMLSELKAVGIDVGKYNDSEKHSDAEVAKYYVDEMTDFFGTSKIDAVTTTDDHDQIRRTRYNHQHDYPTQWTNWKKYYDMKDNIKLATESNNLVNSHDPRELFKGMYTDMLDFDMRGRLVRAFPTFQMFIIDEGKWMTDYRLWDNMYGFNAIESIDVHKNRKIVADTALIKMTNIYSNLTTRPLTENYGDWEYSFWSNLVFGNPSEELLDARKELLTGMLLQTGARIHLRMGYGSSVEHLPVVFNGTITEMDVDKLITIVAQGDGIELTNVISGDPGDDNKEWGQIREPRDTICKLMTSKGNWFKDAINWHSEGKFFKDNPLGVQHFGMPTGEKVPPGTVYWFNTEYGETAQNIYSSNGSPTFSQWVYGDGSAIPFHWDGFIPEWQGGDESDIKMSFYNKTIWDIATTIEMCTPDYITAVAPFELRSTLFFGKPYFQMAYRYDTKYEYDEGSKQWIRNLQGEVRKPFMQFHWYGNDTDIISNKIKASADGIYTNVIAQYGDKTADIAYADWDIRHQYQKTTVVEAPIMPHWIGDFWTSEDQARMYAYSTIKNYMKDMYQGSLVVLGDPSLKPHDMCYIGDQIHDMSGNFQVKDVTHHFSFDTGFVSSITPDAVVVNDDTALLNLTAWWSSAGSALLTRFMGIRLATKSATSIMGKVMAQKHIAAGTKYSQEYIKKSLNKMMRTLPAQDTHVADFKRAYRSWVKASDAGDTDAIKRAVENMDKAIANLDADTKISEWQKAGLFDKKGGKFKTKRLLSLMKTSTKVIKDGKNAFWLLRAARLPLLGTNVIGWIAMLGAAVITETLAEMYNRKKANYQCVLMLPLKHQGRDFTAGINGHKGMVVGDSPGKMDNFLKGAGWVDGENAKDEDALSIIDVFDFLAESEGSGPDTTSLQELETGVYRRD